MQAVPWTSYNAITELEVQASERLLHLLQRSAGGKRMDQVLWAASGSEAIQKALWAAMAVDPTRPMIVATRYGFHGKKGLSHAVSGHEQDHERDPRVKFISFPMHDCQDLETRHHPFDLAKYELELDQLVHQFGRRIGVFITEPYLGGGGSYHPPRAYLQMLQDYCRRQEWIFILDEVQSNFGRTGKMFAYESYGLEPDVVVLGKGLGNGVPVAAAAGKREVLSSMKYGEASDTWSANPLASAAVLATLDEFETNNILEAMKPVSRIIELGLISLKQYPMIAAVRGEEGGMVWGLETKEYADIDAPTWANRLVQAAYDGAGPGQPGVHLLGPLARKVLRIAPPLTLTDVEAHESLKIMAAACLRALA